MIDLALHAPCRAERAAAEAADPTLRGIGAFGKAGACAGGCGFFAIANSIYCSKCIPAVAAPPISPDAVCPKCGKDLSDLGPLRKGRHLERCVG